MNAAWPAGIGQEKEAVRRDDGRVRLADNAARAGGQRPGPARLKIAWARQRLS
jgi:hypothetical protein